MKAKPITDNSFMIQDDTGERIGVVVQNPNQVWFLTPQGKFEFETLDELFEVTGPLVLQDRKVKVVQDQEIDGYPIRHSEYHDVEQINLNGTDIQTYTNSPGSAKRWAVGWYAVKYDRHLAYLSPKINALEEREFLGPYKTQHEAMADAKSRNRK